MSESGSIPGGSIRLKKEIKMTDNWEHKTEGMVCETCMFFVPKRSQKVGRCRRHSPTMSGWPVMFVSDWCGDHKLESPIRPELEPGKVTVI